MKNASRYQLIADELRDLIEQGAYCPGEKLPSIRRLASQYQASITTIQRALEELESTGLIEAKPKSGNYVRFPLNEKRINRQQLTSISTVAQLLPKSVKIHEQANHIFQQCEKVSVANLGTSYPASSYFPGKWLQQIAGKVAKQQTNEVLEVHFSPGLADLREVLAKRLNRVGCQLKADDLIVTNGCLEALSICLRAVAKPGDTIALESPGFVGLFQLIESMGYKALEIPCDPIAGMSLDALEFATQQWDIKAVALVASFSNPLGSNMPEENRQRLVEMLSSKDIPLIEDDLLGDLSFDGSRSKPCKAFDKKGIVLYCSSASKTIASGLRVGWIAPGAFYKEVSYFKTFTNISVSNFGQRVVAEFLTSGRYEKHLRQLTTKLAQRVYLVQQLIETHFPEGTRFSTPRGGGILWVELPPGVDGYQLFLTAIEVGIAVIPGKLSSATDRFDRYIRINCACEQHIDMPEVIAKLAKLVHRALANSL